MSEQFLIRSQVREVDRIAIEEIGIPGVVLMENAGRSATEVVLEMLEELDENGMLNDEVPRVAVLCGSGNNGGDGYVIARQLYNVGIEVAVFATKDASELTGDAKINADIWTNMQMPAMPLQSDEQVKASFDELGSADLIVDSLLGTGFTGDVSGSLVEVIKTCNELHRDGVAVLSVDVPSGLDCDTGEPSNATIEADTTVSFVAKKKGFTKRAARFTGQVVVGDIGAPIDLIERVVAE